MEGLNLTDDSETMIHRRNKRIIYAMNAYDKSTKFYYLKKELNGQWEVIKKNETPFFNPIQGD